MSNKLGIFTDDNDIRTIVSYGKIIVGISDTVGVVVYVKNLNDEQEEDYTVLLTDIFKIKIGAMFKGQEKLDKYYSDYDAYRYEENLQFSFDFNEKDTMNVIFTKSKNEFERETEQPYDNNTVNNLKPQNSTVYAKLENESGITVYVPLLSCLFQDILPREKVLFLTYVDFLLM